VTVASSLTPFEAVRGRLFGIAYRMLGSRSEAEDVVQDTYMRWHQAARGEIQNPEAWLVTAATRLAIDRLRVLKKERETYTGPWLPEPLTHVEAARPDAAFERADDLSVAFLTVLERLAPEERAAFLLHDVFDCSYGDVAAALEKSEAACRQIVHRARERVRADRKRFEVTEAARTNLVKRFVAALDARDEQALVALFTPDATWTADGGGRVPASPRPLVTAERIAKVLIALQRNFYKDRATFSVAPVNGQAGVLVHVEGRLIGTVSFDCIGDRLAAGYAVVNPDKLGPAGEPR
jgi:RNA polymerase sigma-70 factor, ECF subfamily